MTTGAETTTDEVLEGVELDGTTALVTGASTGLGLETARSLAAAGATVVLGVRTEDKGEEATAAIRERHPDATVAYDLVDLADLDTVRSFAERFCAAYDRLDLLINNAGVMFTPLGRTAEGHELQFGVNHIGHFVLTLGLEGPLRAAPGARIVNLSSGGHTMGGIHWDDPDYRDRPYDKFEAYGQSKTANILFTIELDRRWAPDVRSFAVHPGRVGTDLGRYMTKDDVSALIDRAARGPAAGLPPMKSIPAGAATSVWAAVSDELSGQGGLYLADCAVATPAPHASGADDAERLWELTEQLLGG